MKLLCIDTTKQKANIVLNNEGVKSYLEISEAKKHSESLLFELENFLCNNKLTIKNINFLGAVTGPGSFTGIRIGMTTVKAFSFALNLPIVSADYFSIVSKCVVNGCVILKNTATSCYFTEITNGLCSEIKVVDNSDILTLVGDKNLFIDAQEQILEVMSYKNINIINNFNELMLNYFTDKVDKGEFTKPSEFVPTYAQLSQAEKNLKD